MNTFSSTAFALTSLLALAASASACSANTSPEESEDSAGALSDAPTAQDFRLRCASTAPNDTGVAFIELAYGYHLPGGGRAYELSVKTYAKSWTRGDGMPMVDGLGVTFGKIVTKAEWAAIKNNPAPTLNGTSRLFGEGGYRSANDYSGTIAIDGTLANVKGLSVDFDWVSMTSLIEGEVPVKSQDTIRGTYASCVPDV